ncbi:MAG: hypothetical protein Q7K03_06360, partial [Dehalococcoidia bacterium]|nr:hypothetical protein [Dehalococcoidia bacterium]
GQQQASAVLVFQSGSSLLVNGQPMSYAVVPEGIRFGTDTLTLSVAGDSLVMTYQDGSRFQCQRTQSAAAGATPTTTTGTQPAGTQQGLLGTWQCQATLGGQTGSMVFVFESASSMRVNGQPFSYASTSGGITIGTGTFTLSVAGDTLRRRMWSLG